MTRVLVTGGAGFIGRHVCSDLHMAGYEVTAVDPAMPPSPPAGIDTAVFGTIERAVPQLDRHDWIVHLGSPVGTYGVVQQAGEVASRILSANAAVIQLAKRWDASVINVSTSEVYGFTGSYHESDTCLVPPRHSARLAYAVGKLAAEQDMHSAGISVRTIRPFNVCGPGQSAELGFVLPRWCRQVLHGGALTLFGNGRLRRAPMHVGDFCRLVRLLLMADVFRRAPAVLNAGNPANATEMGELAERVRIIGERITDHAAPRIAYVNGKDIFGAHWEEAEGDAKLPVIDQARSIGWEPQVPLDAIIEDVFRSLL